MRVRVAIGANPQSLVRLMVRQALVLVALGLILGLLATRWLAGFAESQLYQVDTSDPATLAAAAATVLLAAVVAAYVPARRASKVDPVVVLRSE
jgi:ABC-type antimicrobial peptide transport system permease subunit